MADISANLKKFRYVNEMTQQEVADKLGIDRTTYSKYEGGRANPQFDNVLKLASIFGISVSDICGTDKPLYGLSDGTQLNDEEARLLLDFKGLSEMRKAEVLRVLKRLSRDQQRENAAKKAADEA